MEELMETQLSLDKAEIMLKDLAHSFNKPEENRLDTEISAEQLKLAVKRILIEEEWGYLSAITAMDNAEYEIDETTKEKLPLPGKGLLEVLYHFCDAAAVLTLRITLPYDAPQIDSICDLLPSATLYEREAMELMGIEFVGTPDTSRLILPENWPDGVYPLRKTFTGLNENAKGQIGR